MRDVKRRSRLTYPKPIRVLGATVWSAKWRRRWSAIIGPVFVDRATGSLVAMFLTPPSVSAGRLTPQAELEARPNGTAQVIGACSVIPPLRDPTMVTADYARDWDLRWYAGGGDLKAVERLLRSKGCR